MYRLPSALRVLVLVTCASAILAATARADEPNQPPAKPIGRWQDASLEDYSYHLIRLVSLTQACAKARNVKTCDPTLVGPDDRIPLGSGANAVRRIVRYGWLRILFAHAEEPDKPAETRKQAEASKPEAQAPPSTSQLLEDAQARLLSDLEQAQHTHPVPAAHDQQRQVMKRVLEGREFRDLKQPTERDTALERFENWINRLFANMNKMRARSAWVGRALVWGLFLAIGIGLSVMLIRMERRWRVRLVPVSDRPAPDAASARDWQLWMGDARQAAAAGMWREAIHFLYWSVISRLESKRLWPADRARTPREYLALVAPDDARRESLGALTRSFERHWYGGRAAGQEDYRAAEALASDLISGSGAAAHAGAAQQPATAEGGVA